MSPHNAIAEIVGEALASSSSKTSALEQTGGSGDRRFGRVD